MPFLTNLGNGFGGWKTAFANSYHRNKCPHHCLCSDVDIRVLIQVPPERSRFSLVASIALRPPKPTAPIGGAPRGWVQTGVSVPKGLQKNARIAPFRTVGQYLLARAASDKLQCARFFCVSAAICALSIAGGEPLLMLAFS